MAQVFRKAMVWLGLGPDEEYDDYGYGYGEPAPGRGPGPGGPPGPALQRSIPGQPQRPVAPGRPQPRAVPDGMDDGMGQPRPAVRPAVRPIPSREGAEGAGAVGAPERPVRRQETPTVRPMRPTAAKPTVVHPANFDDAKDVADRFKAGQPVVMHFGEVERELGRRLIDFGSGLCYALGGNMERVGQHAYLLTPANVDVSDEERRRLRSSGR